jgi:hypothetical protein
MFRRLFKRFVGIVDPRHRRDPSPPIGRNFREGTAIRNVLATDSLPANLCNI